MIDMVFLLIIIFMAFDAGRDALSEYAEEPAQDGYLRTIQRRPEALAGVYAPAQDASAVAGMAPLKSFHPVASGVPDGRTPGRVLSFPCRAFRRSAKEVGPCPLQQDNAFVRESPALAKRISGA